MLTRSAFVALAFGLLATTGCGPGKLDETKTVTLDETHSAASVQLTAQKKSQNITVEFESSDGEVSVYLFKEEDMKGDDALIFTPGSKAIEKKSGKSGSFTAELPASTAARVVVRGAQAKKTDVKLHITNR